MNRQPKSDAPWSVTSSNEAYQEDVRDYARRTASGEFDALLVYRKRLRRPRFRPEDFARDATDNRRARPRTRTP